MKRSNWLRGKIVQKKPDEIFSKLVGSIWERNIGFDLDFMDLPYAIKISRVEVSNLGVEVFFHGDSLLKHAASDTIVTTKDESYWSKEEFSLPITFENLMVWYSLGEVDDNKLAEAAALSRRVHVMGEDFKSPLIDENIEARIDKIIENEDDF